MLIFHKCEKLILFLKNKKFLSSISSKVVNINSKEGTIPPELLVF